MNRKNEEPTAPVLRAIDNLCSMTKYNIDSGGQIKQAFLLGLWHGAFPEYMQGDVEVANWWDYYKNLGEPGTSMFDSPYSNLQRFQFISATGDSWHQCYQDLRKRGWQRLKVHRDGGRLQYLMHNERPGMPEGYQNIHLVLDISISTCKQVQVGTETKEVPIMKTVCEDLVEVADDQEMKYSVEGVNLPEDPPAGYAAGLVAAGAIAEVTPLVVINDLDKVEDPIDHYDNMAEQGIILSTNKDNEIPF